MTNEPTVTLRSLPAGYSFVPKGNVYITGNCRRQAQKARETVYLVVNSKQNQIGLAVPREIHDHVRRMEVETREDRAKNVERKDASLEKEFDKVIRQEFPHIPAASLPQVLNHALKKGKGKVGRTSTLDMRQKAYLAVRAHIRHCHTSYDQLMRAPGGSLPKHEAREAVTNQVNSISRSWGGKVLSKPAKKRAGPRSRAAMAVCAASATVPPNTDTLGHDGRQRYDFDQQPLPMPASRTTKGAVTHQSVASDVVIDLTLDDPPQRAVLSRRPLSKLPGQEDEPASRVGPNSAGLPAAANGVSRRAEKQAKKRAKKLAKKIKAKRMERPAKERLRQPARVTRSMQHIDQTMQELVKRLPDSPEPEGTPRPAARGQRR